MASEINLDDTLEDEVTERVSTNIPISPERKSNRGKSTPDKRQRRNKDATSSKESETHEQTSSKNKDVSPMDRLRQLHMRRNQARVANMEAVRNEKEASTDDGKSDMKLEKKRREAEVRLAKLEAEANGQDFERIQSLKYTAEQVESYEKFKDQKRRKQNSGFSDFKQASIDKYDRLVDSFVPDANQYEKLKSRLGNDNFYRENAASMLSVQHDVSVTSLAKEKLTDDVQAQIKKRSEYHRRRTYKDKDVNFINERNRKFNEKIQRAFGDYTADIRDNLERGTAL